jgi:hypothetical protein
LAACPGANRVPAVNITSHAGARQLHSWRITIERDLTEEKRLQSKFLQAPELGTVARLAGGIAHNFHDLAELGACRSMKQLT